MLCMALLARALPGQGAGAGAGPRARGKPAVESRAAPAPTPDGEGARVAAIAVSLALAEQDRLPRIPRPAHPAAAPWAMPGSSWAARQCMASHRPTVILRRAGLTGALHPAAALRQARGRRSKKPVRRQ